MRIIKLKEVIHTTGLARATIYRYMDKGLFPEQVPLTDERAVGWVESEVQEWILAKVAARDS